MKLTRKKALEICRDLWRWLAKDPDRMKEEWPGWKTTGRMAHDCPCCQYVTTKLKSCGEMPCRDIGDSVTPVDFAKAIALCPLKTLWPDGCCNSGPFDEWWRRESEQANAAKIANACTLELKKRKRPAKAKS